MNGKLDNYSKVIKDTHEKISKYYGIVDLSGRANSDFEGWVFKKSVEKPVEYIVNKHIAKNSKIAEFGCGNGQIVQVYIKNGVSEMVGLDFSNAMLQTASHRADINGYSSQFLPINGDMNTLPFKDNHLDTVIIYGVLEHLEKPEKTLKEIFRVIKPNGKLILGVPRRYSLAFFSYFFFGLSLPKWGSNVRSDLAFKNKLKFYKFYTLGDMNKILNKAFGSNYKIVDNIPICYSFMVGAPQKVLIKIFNKGKHYLDRCELFIKKIYGIPAGNYLIIEKSIKS